MGTLTLQFQKEKSRSTWKNSMCSALISLSIFCYRYCYTEHIFWYRYCYSFSSDKTASRAEHILSRCSAMALLRLSSKRER